MSPKSIGAVHAVLTGVAVPYVRAGLRSAIHKQVRDGAVDVGPLGLSGDEHGDPRVHGGPDKALHAYARSHYAWWQAQLPGSAARALLAQPGAFGENLSLGEGIDERSTCLGDRWRIGNAVLQVSQGRQPCWKLNDRFGVRDMALRLQNSGRTGWYLRVLQAGSLRAGDTVWLLDRPHPAWPLARLLRVIAERSHEPALLREILALPLPPSWRRLFQRRLETGETQPWDARLTPPVPAPYRSTSTAARST